MEFTERGLELDTVQEILDVFAINEIGAYDTDFRRQFSRAFKGSLGDNAFVICNEFFVNLSGQKREQAAEDARNHGMEADLDQERAIVPIEWFGDLHIAATQAGRSIIPILEYTRYEHLSTIQDPDQVDANWLDQVFTDTKRRITAARSISNVLSRILPVSGKNNLIHQTNLHMRAQEPYLGSRDRKF